MIRLSTFVMWTVSTDTFELKHHGLNHELADVPVRFRYPNNGLSKSNKAYADCSVSLS